MIYLHKLPIAFDNNRLLWCLRGRTTTTTNEQLHDHRLANHWPAEPSHLPLQLIHVLDYGGNPQDSITFAQGSTAILFIQSTPYFQRC